MTDKQSENRVKLPICEDFWINSFKEDFDKILKEIKEGDNYETKTTKKTGESC